MFYTTPRTPNTEFRLRPQKCLGLKVAVTLKAKLCGPAVIFIVLNVFHGTIFMKVYCIQLEPGSNVITLELDAMSIQ